MLRTLDENLWIADEPLRFFGLEVGARMTVIRLGDGRLVLHSPIGYTATLADAVKAQGAPGWIIAPNKFHHLFVSQWHDAFGGAVVMAAPGLAAKRPDLADAVTLSADVPDAWADEIAARPLEGLPLANEHVFFHRPSATLIASDLAFNFGADCPATTRMAIRLTGRLGELAPTMMERMLIRDRAAFRASLEQILEWPFERVVVAHGDVVERGGREALARGYDWLLDGARTG